MDSQQVDSADGGMQSCNVVCSVDVGSKASRAKQCGGRACAAEAAHALRAIARLVLPSLLF